jgi:hypothetical protein
LETTRSALQNIVKCPFEILITIGAIVLVCSLIGSGVFGSPGALKVIVKIKYPDIIKELGAGKAVLDYKPDHASKYKSKTFNADNFPKSVTIKIKNVAVNEAFQVCLSSYLYDEGNCQEGFNSISKSPERIEIRFPH